jgi:hypothetical protein
VSVPKKTPSNDVFPYLLFRPPWHGFVIVSQHCPRPKLQATHTFTE